MNTIQPVPQRRRGHLRADPSKPRPEDRLTIRGLRLAAVAIARHYHRLTVVSPCSMPPRGAGILVSNHISGLDPVLIQAACPRLISWMMAREYYHQRHLKWLFRTIRAIPVSRSGQDLAAMREALRVLHDGGIIGIFPEGRIAHTAQLLSFQTGTALMAIKTGVPIYPVYLDGTQRNKSMVSVYLRPQRAKVTFGEPIVLTQSSTSQEDLETATARIQGVIDAMRITQQESICR